MMKSLSSSSSLVAVTACFFFSHHLPVSEGFSLNILPAPLPSNQTYNNNTWTSWGGNVVFVPEDSNFNYHMFVAFMSMHCSLSSWGSNSLVIHAVSNHSALGPFVYADIALPVYHHNPQVNRHPDGTFLIMTIGMSPEGQQANCTPSVEEINYHLSLMNAGIETSSGSRRSVDHTPSSPSSSSSSSSSSPPPPPPPPIPLSHGFEVIELHHSLTPYGPWIPVTTPGGSLNMFNGTNPSPFALANGTMHVASHNNCGLTLSTTTNWTSGVFTDPICVVPYTAYGDNYTFEDPFLWFDDNEDVWRCLVHQYNRSNTKDQVRLGGVASSTTSDPYGPWVLQSDADPVYTNLVEFMDGSSIAYMRRERPKLFFDPNKSTNVPAVLYTSVCPPNNDNCYNIGVPIGATS